MRLYKVAVTYTMEGQRWRKVYVTWASNNQQAVNHIRDLWKAEQWGDFSLAMVRSVHYHGNRVAEVATYAESA